MNLTGGFLFSARALRGLAFVACVVATSIASAQGAGAFIAASRLFGGGFEDTVQNLARAGDGRLYVYGTLGTPSDPAVASSRFANAGQGHAFVSRIDAASLAIEWTAVVGRQRRRQVALDDRDVVDGFAVAPDGRPYVAAYAGSPRLPEAGGSYVGWGDGKFVYRIESTGTVATFAGPLDPAITSIRALAVDAQGNVYLSGRASASLRTTSGAAVTAAQVAAAGESGAFVLKIDGGTRAVAWATFLGVPGARTATPDEQFCRQPFRDDLTGAHALAVASDGSVIVAGQATANDLPATTGAANTSDARFRDAFVARLNPSGSAIVFVARLGGSDNDRATSVIVASDGTLTVAGKTLDAGQWYGPRGGFQASVQREWSASAPPVCPTSVPTEAGFLTRISASGAQLGVTSIIGTAGGDLVGQLAADPSSMPIRLASDNAGHVYVTGATDPGQSLPTLLPFVPNAALYVYRSVLAQPFVLKVRLSDFALIHGSRFGGRETHGRGAGVATDGQGNVFIVGHTFGGERFPVVNTPRFGRPMRGSAGFVTRLFERPVDLALGISPARPLPGTPVQLTAILGDPAFAGSVEFSNRGMSLGSASLVGGMAQITLPFAAGIHELAVVVRGPGVWNGNATRSQRLIVEQSSALP